MPSIFSVSSDLSSVDSSGGACVCLHAWGLMLWVRQPLTKKKASPSFTWNNGPWNHWGQPCCFSGRRDGPSKPIDWRRSRVAPLLCETQNTQWRGGTMQGGTSFTLFFFFPPSPPFSGSGGSMRRQLSPGEDRGVMWESSARSRTPAEASTCASVLSLLGVFFVFSLTQRG